MKTQNIIIFSIFFLAAFIPGFIKAQPHLDNHPYINPTPGEITIMAITPIPEGVTPTRKAYSDVVDCGFNMVCNSGNLEYFKNQFELIEGLDLKYMIDSYLLSSSKAKDLVEPLKNYSQLGGWKFKDEPRWNILKDLPNYYEALYQLDSKHLIYMNLIGGVNKVFTGDEPTYPSYLNLIQKMFQPPVWSYDFYPVLTKKGKISVVYGQFYNNFEQIYKISKETKRPFWAYCESMALENQYLSCPTPKEEYLRFEAFTALAYGAQGIVYWTYGQRKSTQTEKYTSALVNLDGKKSKAWYAAQQVNREIKRFNDVFYNCNVLEVRHTGNIKYSAVTKLNGSFGPFSSIQSGNAGVVVSRIENNGNQYIVIVSRDVLATQKITLKLSTNKKVKDLATNVTHISGIPITPILTKGGYKIYQVL